MIVGAAAARPRVLLFSLRNVELPVWHASQHEFEDVIAAVDGVRLLAPKADWTTGGEMIRHRAANVLRRRFGSPIQQLPIEETQVVGEYELFFAIFHDVEDAAYLSRLPGWRERVRKAACFVVELWSRDVPQKRRYIELLSEFDHIFTFNAGNAAALAAITGRPVTFLAAAVDAPCFAPVPISPARYIDVYSMGRRPGRTHDVLSRLAAAGELHYMYDTSASGLVINHVEHRALLANIIKRSRYFIAHRINADPARLKRTGGEDGLSTRYFEGAAGGAVMLGSRPNCPEWDAHFDWPDALIEVPYDPPDLTGTLRALDADPDRLARARQANVVNTLRRHDWLYRWRQVLDVAGLPHTPAMHDRAALLAELAAAAAGGVNAERGLASLRA